MAIRRLKRDGLIRVGKEGQITLTAEGLEIANRLLNLLGHGSGEHISKAHNALVINA